MEGVSPTVILIIAFFQLAFDIAVLVRLARLETVVLKILRRGRAPG